MVDTGRSDGVDTASVRRLCGLCATGQLVYDCSTFHLSFLHIA